MGTPGGLWSCPSASRSSEQRHWPAGRPPAFLLSIRPLPWVVYWKLASLPGFKALALGTSVAGSRPGSNWQRGCAQRPALTRHPPPALPLSRSILTFQACRDFLLNAEPAPATNYSFRKKSIKRWQQLGGRVTRGPHHRKPNVFCSQEPPADSG